jgi:hypothetical protein
MRQKLFTLSSGVSLLLCVAVCTLWARSGAREDYVYYSCPLYLSPEGDYRLQWREVIYSARGLVGYYHEFREQKFAQQADSYGYGGFHAHSRRADLRFDVYFGFDRRPGDRRHGGFGIVRYVRTDHPRDDTGYPPPPPDPDPQWTRRYHVTAVSTPHWFIALLFAIMPTIWLRSCLREGRRRQIGLCENCGYDLQATPGRCPECGMVPGEPAAA